MPAHTTSAEALANAMTTNLQCIISICNEIIDLRHFNAFMAGTNRIF